MEELKKCPFCGGDAMFAVGETDFGDFSYVRCHGCDAQMSGAHCVARWNNRAPERQGHLVYEK